MENIPTAKEIRLYSRISPEEDMIEFAKLHVKTALEAAAENANTVEVVWGLGVDIVIDKDSILNAYPEENIK